MTYLHAILAGLAAGTIVAVAILLIVRPGRRWAQPVERQLHEVADLGTQVHQAMARPINRAPVRHRQP